MKKPFKVIFTAIVVTGFLTVISRSTPAYALDEQRRQSSLPAVSQVRVETQQTPAIGVARATSPTLQTMTPKNQVPPGARVDLVGMKAITVEQHNQIQTAFGNKPDLGDLNDRELVEDMTGGGMKSGYVFGNLGGGSKWSKVPATMDRPTKLPGDKTAPGDSPTGGEKAAPLFEPPAKTSAFIAPGSEVMFNPQPEPPDPKTSQLIKPGAQTSGGAVAEIDDNRSEALTGVGKIAEIDDNRQEALTGGKTKAVMGIPIGFKTSAGKQGGKVGAQAAGGAVAEIDDNRSEALTGVGKIAEIDDNRQEGLTGGGEKAIIDTNG